MNRRVKMMKSSRDAFTQREEWTDAGLPFVELSGNHPLLISRPSQRTRGARMKEFRAFLFNFPFNSSFLHNIYPYIILEWKLILTLQEIFVQ